MLSKMYYKFFNNANFQTLQGADRRDERKASTGNDAHAL
jgi:hypothetical protein